MTKVKVSKINIDDDLYIKSEKLKINKKTIKTPIKSFDMTKLRTDTEVSSLVKGSNEIFKIFNAKDIEKYAEGSESTEKIYKDLNKHYNKTSGGEINFCFTMVKNYNSLEEKEIDILTNIAYSKSDATPLPIFEKIFSRENSAIETNYTDFIDLMQKSIDSINRLNNKPILGIIPSSVPDALVPYIVEFYYDNDITSFAYDFEGKTHAGLYGKLRELMISIIKLDILNESFIYSLNTQRGKVTRGTNVTKGNDILVYNFGFDIMGDNHIPQKFPPHVAKAIKERSKSSEENPIIRLFNTEDYGHYKHDNLNSASEMYPFNETSIPFENFESDIVAKRDMSQRLFNSERIGFELLKYQNLIRESDSTVNYLKTKDQINNDLDYLQSFRKDIKL